MHKGNNKGFYSFYGMKRADSGDVSEVQVTSASEGKNIGSEALKHGGGGFMIWGC